MYRLWVYYVCIQIFKVINNNKTMKIRTINPNWKIAYLYVKGVLTLGYGTTNTNAMQDAFNSYNKTI